MGLRPTQGDEKRLLSEAALHESAALPFDTEAIKRLVKSGFGCSILPVHALRDQSCFFELFRVQGHRLNRTVALATVRTDYPAN
jgi:hypothetical protein